MKWKFIVVLLNMGTYTETVPNRDACHDVMIQYKTMYTSEYWDGVCLDPEGEIEDFSVTTGSKGP